MLKLKLQYFGHLMQRVGHDRATDLILKKINPEYLLEGLMLKLKLQYFGHLI